MHERIAAKYHLISENDFKKIDYKRIGLLLSNFVAMLFFFFKLIISFQFFVSNKRHSIILNNMFLFWQSE